MASRRHSLCDAISKLQAFLSSQPTLQLFFHDWKKPRHASMYICFADVGFDSKTSGLSALVNKLLRLTPYPMRSVGSARSLYDARLVCLQVGIVQTAYANGASTNFMRSDLGIEVAVTPTGVKYLHEEAVKFDIGIYFEANGHGTVLFSDSLLQRLTQVWTGAPDQGQLPGSNSNCSSGCNCSRTAIAKIALMFPMCCLSVCLSVCFCLHAAVAATVAIRYDATLAGMFVMAALVAIASGCCNV